MLDQKLKVLLENHLKIISRDVLHLLHKVGDSLDVLTELTQAALCMVLLDQPVHGQALLQVLTGNLF